MLDALPTLAWDVLFALGAMHSFSDDLELQVSLTRRCKTKYSHENIQTIVLYVEAIISKYLSSYYLKGRKLLGYVPR